MEFSNFIVLLARQRSGTHALRSLLESHADIFGVEEVFHLKDAQEPNPGLPIPETNFFTFVKRYVRGDIHQLLPVDYEPLLLAYLEFLRGLTSKRYLVLDVKFNIVHHVTRNFQPLAGPPYLFELILKHGLRTFLLTRKNYLRAFLSVVKTRATQNFHLAAGLPGTVDPRIKINVKELLFELKRWRAEDELVDSSFTTFPSHYDSQLNYRQKYFTWDYADLFDPHGEGLAPRFSNRFSNWLGIPNKFGRQSAFQKFASLPLRETIENYADVVKALRGTPFEYCLQDEPIHSTSGGVRRGWRQWFPGSPALVRRLIPGAHS